MTKSKSFKFAATCVFGLMLSACNSVNYDDFQSASVKPVNFAESKPVDFPGRGPAAFPVHGTDVSKYQGDIDWDAAHANGVSFAFIKATEGGDRIDEKFARNFSGTRAARIPRAAYHFYYFCTPAAQQAAWFIRNVPADPSALPPLIDLEWNPDSPTCTTRPAPETVRSEVMIFSNALERHYGKRPLLYVTPDFYRDNLQGHFKSHQFFLRAVADHPSGVYPDRAWSFWQYSGTGSIPGIKGGADMNVFNGNIRSWKQWLASNN